MTRDSVSAEREIEEKYPKPMPTEDEKQKCLIAAAPDLLAALRALLATNSCRDATYQNNIQLAEAVDVARAAIAKARG